MIIDAHNHPDWAGHDLPRSLANMAQHGIDKTWLLSWECPRDEYAGHYSMTYPDFLPDCPVSFSRCISYAERVPGKFIPGYSPDPRRPDAIARLNAAATIYDARLYGELKVQMMFDNLDGFLKRADSALS
jgi:hypothetical protein